MNYPMPNIARRAFIDKNLERRKKGIVRRFKAALFDNWCLKRSKLIYFFASRLFGDDIKINIAMRCRSDSRKDWGHAWVTRGGTPFLERNLRLIEKRRTLIAEDNKYIYWIYD